MALGLRIMNTVHYHETIRRTCGRVFIDSHPHLFFGAGWLWLSETTPTTTSRTVNVATGVSLTATINATGFSSPPHGILRDDGLYLRPRFRGESNVAGYFPRWWATDHPSEPTDIVAMGPLGYERRRHQKDEDPSSGRNLARWTPRRTDEHHR